MAASLVVETEPWKGTVEPMQSDENRSSLYWHKSLSFRRVDGDDEVGSELWEGCGQSLFRHWYGENDKEHDVLHNRSFRRLGRTVVPLLRHDVK